MTAIAETAAVLAELALPLRGRVCVGPCGAERASKRTLLVLG